MSPRAGYVRLARDKPSAPVAQVEDDDEMPEWVLADLDMAQVIERSSDAEEHSRVAVYLPHGGSPWCFDDATARERLAVRYPDFPPQHIAQAVRYLRRVIQQRLREKHRGPCWVTSW